MSNTHKYTSRYGGKYTGFTLVELAIAMTIIGLLISGVLKGQQLIFNARMNATISDWQAIQIATLTFMDKYAAAPGDYSRATTRLVGCGGMTAAGNWCTNGDSDSIIGLSSTPPSWSMGIGTVPSTMPIGINILDADPIELQEHTQFWKHLAMSNLISSVDPSANGDPTDPANDVGWGTTHPDTPFSGGYHMYFYNLVGGNAPGQWVAIRRGLVGGLDERLEMLLTVSEATSLDIKIDDGELFSGFVYSLCFPGPTDPSATCMPSYKVK